MFSVEIIKEFTSIDYELITKSFLLFDTKKVHNDVKFCNYMNTELFIFNLYNMSDLHEFRFSSLFTWKKDILIYIHVFVNVSNVKIKNFPLFHWNKFVTIFHAILANNTFRNEIWSWLIWQSFCFVVIIKRCSSKLISLD